MIDMLPDEANVQTQKGLYEESADHRIGAFGIRHFVVPM